MDDIRIDINGLDDINRMLNTLPNEVSAKIQQELAMKAANIVKADLINAAASVEGNNDKPSSDKLSSNVKVQRNEKGAAIGFTKKVWYVKLIEKGTAVREKKSGASTGSMPKRPFIGKVHEDAAPKVFDFLQKNYLKIINNAIKKQLKKVQSSIKT